METLQFHDDYERGKNSSPMKEGSVGRERENSMKMKKAQGVQQ